VSVVGDFNGWSCDANPMYKIAEGIWQIEILGVKNYDSYKYAVTSCEGKVTLKSDPYARHFETAPANASKVYIDDAYEWGDAEWRNTQKDIMSSPVNIYEVHLGSWNRFSDGNTYAYVTAAKEISKYV
jgi:1,4-alpha-glucan branching enzyme